MKCACCGKPIRKATTTVYVKAQRSQYDVTSRFISHVYPVEGWPQSKADCQKLVNERVISVRYNKDKLGVHSFTTWDGKTYLPSWGYFCTNACAGQFAEGVVHRLREKRTAA